MLLRGFVLDCQDRQDHRRPNDYKVLRQVPLLSSSESHERQVPRRPTPRTTTIVEDPCNACVKYLFGRLERLRTVYDYRRRRPRVQLLPNTATSSTTDARVGSTKYRTGTPSTWICQVPLRTCTNMPGDATSTPITCTTTPARSDRQASQCRVNHYRHLEDIGVI